MLTKTFTPLFNRPDFHSYLEGKPYDDVGHIRVLETFLFPKRRVALLSSESGVARVESPDYGGGCYYTSISFLSETTEETKSYHLPSRAKILQALASFPQMPYLLGGNCIQPTQMHFQSTGNPFTDRYRNLFGIDCSGLLYYVCNGQVPRNTSDLVSFGKEVKTLEPLDLIVWSGHVIIYQGGGWVIESRGVDGVVRLPWAKRREQIADRPYRFIRFHPEAF